MTVAGGSGPVEVAVLIYRDGEIALDPKRAALLEAIERTGSISAAARDRGISYRHAWLMVDGMNRLFNDRVVEAFGSGREGGGSRLTATGGAVLRSYGHAGAAMDDGCPSSPFRQITDLLRRPDTLMSGNGHPD